MQELCHEGINYHFYKWEDDGNADMGLVCFAVKKGIFEHGENNGYICHRISNNENDRGLSIFYGGEYDLISIAGCCTGIEPEDLHNNNKSFFSILQEIVEGIASNFIRINAEKKEKALKTLADELIEGRENAIERYMKKGY